MSFHLIIIQQAPYLGRSSSEIIEAIMSLALFDVEHRVVFFGDGVTWLLENQQPEAQKSLEKQLKALPIYGSEDLYFCQEHARLRIGEEHLSDLAEPISEQEIAQWMRQAQQVEVF